jgi:tetratricopeptide (TPR) repeat protein
MKNLSLLPMTCGLVGGAGLTAAILMASSAQTAEPLPRLEQSLARVERDVDSLAERVGELERRGHAGSQTRDPSSRAPLPSAPAQSAESSMVASTDSPAATPGSDALAQLLLETAASGYTREARKKLFDLVRRSGAQQAAVEAIKAHVQANASSAPAHYLLAQAYYQQIMTESTPARMEALGNLVLSEYDAALELDSRYWEPRSDKATYLSYYPETEGKTPEAIREFETLLAQQSGSNKDPRYANTYLQLARLYVRVGKRDQAVTLLRDGLALFPDQVELRQQLETMEGR